MASDEPEPVDLRTLRLLYTRAVFDGQAGELVLPVGASGRAILHERERGAGRAFLAALQAEDPACVTCGCTMFDPCFPPCYWLSLDPAVCSSCASKETIADGG